MAIIKAILMVYGLLSLVASSLVVVSSLNNSPRRRVTDKQRLDFLRKWGK